MRTLDDWFADYAARCPDPARAAAHALCASAGAFAVIAALWTVPPMAPQWFRPGVWAVLAMFPAYGFYHRLSRNLAYAMAVALVAGGALAWFLYTTLGPRNLLTLALALFLLGCSGAAALGALQPRTRPFGGAATQLLIGPAWLVARGLRRMGIRY